MEQFNLDAVIASMIENVSVEERETQISIEGKQCRIYSSDGAWVRHNKKKILSGLNNGKLKVERYDAYGITFSGTSKIISLALSNDRVLTEEERAVKAEAARQRFSKK